MNDIKIFRSRKFLIKYIIVISIVSTIVGLIIWLEKNNSYREWRKDEFVRSCIQENQNFLQLVEGDTSWIEIDSYCQCYVDWAISLSKERLDQEDEIVWALEFFDKYVREKCPEKDLYSQLQSSDRIDLALKICDWLIAVNEDRSERDIDCKCFAMELEKMYQEWNILSAAWLQLAVMNESHRRDMCKN